MEIEGRKIEQRTGRHCNVTEEARRAWIRIKGYLRSRGAVGVDYDAARVQINEMAYDAARPGYTYADVLTDVARQLRDGCPLSSIKVAPRTRL